MQGFSLLVIPAIGYGVAELLRLSSFDRNLCNGIIIASCIPTTISSNVLMTKSAGGNEAASLTNAVLGSILGVFLSPALIFWLLGLGSSSHPINYGQIFGDLAVTVVSPLVLGQLIRFFFGEAVDMAQRHLNFSIINSSLLLLLVYQVFCNTFASNAFQVVSATSFVAVVFLVIIMFLFFSGMVFLISRIEYLRFSRPDTIAIVMCGATKSAALGIPLINVMFSGNAAIGILSLPLLMYHAGQLLAGSFLVTYFTGWVKRGDVSVTSQDTL